MMKLFKWLNIHSKDNNNEEEEDTDEIAPNILHSDALKLIDATLA